MIAASLNLALGNAGLMLMLASIIRCTLTVLDVRTGNQRPLRLAPRYAWLGLGGVVLAVVMMQRALITRDFSIAYVQQVGSTTTPPLYNVAAMWSSLEGSILLWAIILAGYTAAVAWRFRRRTDDPLVGWALVVMFVVAAFFASSASGPHRRSRTGRLVSRRSRSRTRCSRTTSSCCSTHRSCTWATSGSRCRSRSRSRP